MGVRSDRTGSLPYYKMEKYSAVEQCYVGADTVHSGGSSGDWVVALGNV